ncbi:hypothetical protein BCV72DRAFT_330039 [Rhizopus microsporus var. microsporus]|uniref:Uncharacterized protein n=2 Tax=Rhizopus microsporus TaxID=58291 RepID=A0A2G4SKD7_RHIZD|nr:uncharacterized protein RHIMIDRAFT_246202 [Rhizopus microsporus ATCC 52813]ORE05864.1 hypothetical protein BCV72DRAFT_330039 [Rhizopus microsporus var. microsporus]PHZ09231.1 hypothetical protein RHIMIDRAFT_246202 [Rhizopus microsporus ATCC 52813]
MKSITPATFIPFLLLVTFCIYLLFIWRSSFPPPSSKQQQQQQQQLPNTSRLASNSRRHRITSVLAHIRTSYVTNRTPDISTPPLLILYSCKPNQQCGTLAERMLDITHAYYNTMLHPKDAAFAYDMIYPVQFEWFLEPSPGYMAMRTWQAQYYLNRTEHQDVTYIPIINEASLADVPQRIIGTTVWQERTNWNKTAAGKAGQYGLSRLAMKSDWFLIVSRLLFYRPTDWLSQQLEPYRELMGGQVRLGEGLNMLDPHNAILPPSHPSWFRVGVRVTDMGDVDRTAAQVQQVCVGNCHVFISATSPGALARMRQRLLGVCSVHAVAEGHSFEDLDTPPKTWRMFQSDEEQLKKQYARVFMDWMILTRMDYLIGREDDQLLKVAAWSAQVQTDVMRRDGSFISFTDW